MIVQIVLFMANMFLVNIVFVLAFLVRYGLPIPERSFLPYKSSFMFLMLIYAGLLAVY